MFGIDLQAEGTPYKEYVLYFSLLAYVGEQYLSLRQYRKLCEPDPPKSLQDIDEVKKKFQSAQAYGKDRLKFRFVSEGFLQLQTMAYLVFDLYPWLWDVSGNWLAYAGYGEEYEITQSLVFTVLFSLLTWIMYLPLTLYNTFVIEERHGFNKMTLRLFFMDTLKGFLLAGVIGLPVVATVLQIIKWTGYNFYIYVWAFMLVFNFILITIYPTFIQPLFNKVDPLPDGPLRTEIEKLASSINFPLKQLYIIDGSTRSAHSNAYFYGFFKNKRIVLFDTLLDQVEQEEILAIVGHELGHWALNHTVKVLVISQAQIFMLFY
ncbi:4989_t:CDS:2, partial [Paraglomus occultum]